MLSAMIRDLSRMKNSLSRCDMHTKYRLQLNIPLTPKSSTKSLIPARNHNTGRLRRHDDFLFTKDLEFQAKATFKRIIKKVISSLRVTNAFLRLHLADNPMKWCCSCLGNSSSLEKYNGFQYYVDILDINGSGDEDEGLDNGANSPKPLFDPAWFKANREIRLGSETKTILSQEPSSRTPEQVQTVFRYLSTLPSFAEYPLYHQKAICQVASYQSFPVNVTILKQGHRADNFYFVLSGSATIISNRESLDSEKDDDNNSESVSVVKRGMSFGEAAVMNNSLRNVTIISKTHIELLVVSKEDYAKTFFGTDSVSGKTEYITFLRTIDFLRDWPVDILDSNPEQSQHCYFRRGAVIVRNSNNSRWLYVIKSGVCEVLIKLNTVKPRKAIGRTVRKLSCLEELTKLTLEQRQELKNTKDKITNFPSIEQSKCDKRNISKPQRLRRETLCYVPELGLVNSRRHAKEDSFSSKINSITEEDFVSDFSNDVDKTTESRKTSSTSRSSSSIRRVSCEFPKLNKLNSVQTFCRRKARPFASPNINAEDLNPMPKKTRSYSLPSTISGQLTRISRTKPAFVRIDLLHPKRVFGLSELDFEYNALHPGRPASVSLVSRGAECIMISKKFFMEHANALTKRWIRLNVQPYLPMENHQQTLQEKIDWETFKKKIVDSIVL